MGERPRQLTRGTWQLGLTDDEGRERATEHSDRTPAVGDCERFAGAFHRLAPALAFRQAAWFQTETTSIKSCSPVKSSGLRV